MRSNGFSLIEALIAASIIAIGLTAAASLVGALMAKEEMNATALRAANLQDQAVSLYRLGLSPARIRAILPETCSDSTTPTAGTYGLTFSSESAEDLTASDGRPFRVLRTSSSVIYPVTGPDGDVLSYSTNTVTIVEPSTKWPVP